ncbi:SDR family NAD(P)-dependent oxidoreductase, partial [Saccharopolyspora indica]
MTTTAAEPNEPIAVVGMSCRLPGAPDPGGFWRLLREGRSAIAEVPADRSAQWDPEALRRMPTTRGGFLEAVDRFDAGFFGISPREAAATDPQQRLMLELAWEAVEHAGLLPVPGRVGVFVGAIWDDYALLTHRRGPDLVDPHTFTGLNRGLIANRVSYALGFTGPSMVVDTAQSSSLVAVHLACESLRRGEADVAVAGGVNLLLAAESGLGAAGFGGLSPDGDCYPFDARANGFVRGEGGGAVLLKPLAAALADGDRVFGVLRGSAVNNDGASVGLTAPDADAQRDVVRAAFDAAGLAPSAAQYVELHGTGTPVGDPVEARALGAALGTGRDADEALLVGSVKANVGHLEGAAGIVGLLKVVLSLDAGEIPASLNFRTPNPDIPLEDLRLRVARTAGSWPRPSEPLVAGVSSFGMGGTNCHVVVTAAPEPAAPRRPSAEPGAVLPFVVSGRDAAALRAQAARLADAEPGSPADTAFSLATTRSAFPHRAVVLAGDQDELARGLAAVAGGLPAASVVRGTAAEGRRVGLLFAGQGAQRAGMGRELAARFPVFSQAFDAVCAEFADLGVPGLADVVRTGDGLERTEFAQPALFAYEFALAELYRSWGVEPEAVTGHSVGEFAAACVAGVLSRADACQVVAARGRLMQALPAGGAMVAVEAAEEDVRPLLAGAVDLAAVNGPRAVVLSGAEDDVAAVLARLPECRTKRLRVSHAFHSPLVEPMLAEFAAVLSTVEFSAPAVPFVSAVTGAVAADEVASPEYWVRHARDAVRFGDAVAAIRDLGMTDLLEVGPDGTVAALAREIGGTTVHTGPRPDRAEDAAALAGAAGLFARGLPIDWTAVVDGERVPLPTYAFQRTRHWLPAAPSASPAVAPPPAEPAPEPEAVPADWSAEDLVLRTAAAVLGHAGPDAIDPDATFRDLGLSSLTSVEFRDALAAATGLRLPAGLLFDHPTPTALIAHLDSRRDGGTPDPGDATSAEQSDVDDDPIAIVGLGCRLPGGVNSPDDLWRLLRERGDAVGAFPTDRGWDLDALHDADPASSGTSYTRSGGFVYDADRFDAAFFGISPREAAAMDPQQRLLLETSWEAVERAGIDPLVLRGSATGVFVGAMAQEYGPGMVDAADAEGYALTGSTVSVASGRIAYTLGLEGPALTVDTACSSSLVALHLAARSLRAGECSLALAGGAAVLASPGMFVEFSRQRGLSPDGRCKAFAAGADGTGWAEGAGVVVLERLSDARRNGHPVLAVIRGSAVNSDGASNGLTAPNGPSQERVIRTALAEAGLTAADVDAVEAHGTGTTLGDPIEAEALQATYGRAHTADRPLLLGSLKSNIGHTQAAAGVAGVIKMVLAMRHGVLPATLHVDEPTPHVDWSAGTIGLLTDETEWPATGRPRRAGVSSFGISGTNAHLILEEGAGRRQEPAGTPTATGPLAWTLSARGADALRGQARRLAEHLDAHPGATAADVAVSLRGRAMLDTRAVVVAGDREALLGGVRVLADGGTSPAVVSGQARRRAKPVLVFPGQGSQWAGMAADLLDDEVFAAKIDECAAAFEPYVDWSLRDVLTGAPGAPELERADVVQPALFAVMVSLAALWRAAGVRPAAVVGHSQGEIAAAHVAGALSLADAARIVVLRSRALGVLAGRGGMVSLPVPVAEVRERLAAYPDRIGVAAINGPAATVVAGDADALDELLAECERDGVHARRVPVDYASHSPHVDAIRDELLDLLAGVSPRSAEIAFYSTVSGGPVDTAGLDAGYWFRNLRQPVLFEQAVRAALADGHDAFVESSPHPVLTIGVQETADAAESTALVCTSLRRNEDGPTRWLTSLAEAHAGGLRIEWPAHAGARIALPTYAFQRQRYWVEPSTRPTDPDQARLWAAVDDADADALAEVLAPDGDRAASDAALPVLAAWRRRTRDRAAATPGHYRVRWQPVPEPAATALRGRWLVVVPDGAETPDLPAEHTAVPVVPGTDRAELARALTGALAGPDPVVGVLSLLPGLIDTIALVQALGDTGSSARLWCATRGAVATGPDDRVTAPAQARLWGLGQVVAQEHPDRWGGLVDLPAELDQRALRRLAAVLAGAAGEDQVALRPSGMFGRRLVPARGTATGTGPDPLRGTVLITGGTGALGGRVARWLAARGTEHVVLAGRRGAAAPGVAALLDDLAETSTRVTAAACDVTDRDALAALLAEHPPTAVVHAAGVLDDGVVDGLTPERVAGVLAAKADAAEVLHELTAGLDLEAFVLFSSVIGVLGNGGQGAYAAANAHLDALAELRRADGLPATSIAWGIWSGGGMADGGIEDRMSGRGLLGMDPDAALAALGTALERGETTLVVADVRWDRFAPVLTAARPSPLIAELPEVAALARETAGELSGLAGRMAGLAPDQQRRVVLDTVRDHAAGVLGHASAGAVVVDKAFREIGFDSLTVVELRNRLAAATGLRLPTTLLFDHPTVTAVADYLHGRLRPDAEAAADGGAVVAARTGPSDEPIAIVAMGCRFPGGVRSPEELWELLVDERDVVSDLPSDRGWDLGGLFDPDPDHHGTSYVRSGGFLHDAAEFDAEFFGISPREALVMDPQQRLLLETSWEAVERAGIDPRALRGSRTGVFAGMVYQDYGTRLHEAPEGLGGFLVTGKSSSVISGRVAYALGLSGPAVTVDTACSSSLVTLHLACQALRAGDCSLALAGGATVMAAPGMFIEFSRQRGLAPDGRCKPFSSTADGTAWGEGAGMLLLERLSDARRNGHPVLAVVRGTAINSDGASNGLTAPNGLAQERVIRDALANAGLSTADVDAVEAHGTGTTLGDPIEARALLATYGQDRAEPLWLGSLKSNIAHPQAAAGVAGVIKMVLALRNGLLPALLHVDEPTPHVDWSAGAVRLLTETRPWPEVDRPLRAGVSAFGVSGTNAHAVLEQAPAEDAPAAVADRAVPLVLAARDPRALAAQAAELADRLTAPAAAGLVDTAFSLATGRTPFDHRAVVVAADRAAAGAALRELAAGTAPSDVAIGEAVPRGRTAFVFPGQGSQWLGMGSALLVSSPVFAARFAECATALEQFVDWSPAEMLGDEPGLSRVDVVQPLLWAVMVSLAAVWESLGVVPDVVVGHSQGEIAAAVVSGALSVLDGARVVALRSRALVSLAGAGGMVSVTEPADRVRERIAGWGERISIAAVNGPAVTVVSGEPAALDELIAGCERDGVRARRIPVDYASHSAQVESLREELVEALRAVRPAAGRFPLLSTVTGEPTDGSDLTGEYWFRNLREPVVFERAVAELSRSGHDVFVECSPHPVLTLGVQQTAEDAVVVGTLRRDDGDWDRVLRSAAEVLVAGGSVDFTPLLDDGRTVDLPTYPFQRKRFWLDTSASAGSATPVPELIAEPVAQFELAGTADGERAEALRRIVRAETAVVLGHADPADVRPARTFAELGVDSLIALQLRNRLVRATGLQLPAAVAFDHPTPAALADHLSALEAGPAPAEAEPAAAPATTGEPIAIVGMACRYPGGVRSPEDLWRLVQERTDAITGFPSDRGWDLGGLFDPDPDHHGTSYVRSGGFLHDAAEFDAEFFG